jgi:membrane peptidoglycan carboxypeptidase
MRLPPPILAGRPIALSILVGMVAILTFFTAGLTAWVTYGVTAGLPTRDDIASLGDMAQSTTLYDAADKPTFTIFKEQRIEIPLSDMSPHFLKAVISVEDQRFYEHGGVDAVRVAAAAVRNIEAGRRAEGGSTITQQLARQSFLSRDKTFRRKLKEVILAGYIENEYTKEQILELYLNKVYFGDGLYGVEAAARGYFGKSAKDLALDQAALLAGLIQSPSSYAPTVNLERAVARRSVVLQTMVNSGAIDAETAARARKAPVELADGLEIRETFGLYFKEQVRRELVERFGWQRVYQGGLRVYTTMDGALQAAAEKLVEKNLAEVEERRGFQGKADVGDLDQVRPAQQHVMLDISTLAFTVCFAVWTVFTIIGVQIKQNLRLNGTEFGLLVAAPILPGSLSRIFLGICADQYGKRLVFTLLMLAARGSPHALTCWASGGYGSRRSSRELGAGGIDKAKLVTRPRPASKAASL